MIAFISGTVVDKDLESVVIDNHGIGYQVYCAKSHEMSLNEPTVLYTYQHVREDAIILFGFSNKQELALFKRIISVKGVGPKTGLGILGKAPANRLIEAVENEDIAFLRTLPGVGPKMASQIVLDLKGKFVSSDQDVPAPSYSNLDDVVATLLELGFKRNEINAIKKELVASDDQSVDGLIKLGLQLLHSRKVGSR